MRVPLRWLRNWTDIGSDTAPRTISDALIRVGLEVETIDAIGADLTGPLMVGQIREFSDETHSNGKTIRWCRVDVGDYNEHGPDGRQAAPTGFDGPGRGIVCGAQNFTVGDYVVVALPGAVLPRDFAITARTTYGHVSDGMICSARELGIGDDHTGILVITPDACGPPSPSAGAGSPDSANQVRHAEPPQVAAGTDAADILQLRDDVLDIAVSPDRGYCLSVRGIAREAALALDTGFTDPVNTPVPQPVSDGYPVELKSPKCPLFVGLTVTDIDPAAPTPYWMASRLRQAGMRSISLIVDVTNYVMLETGQPLHAYDTDRLSGGIVVRTASTGEKLTTLDDVARELDPSDLVIADDSGPIGLAGLMGGASSEVGADTTTVLLEAAHFDASSVALTSRRHKLSSEASIRFERGVDPAAAYTAARRAAQLLASCGAATLSKPETIAGAPPVPAGQSMADQLPAQIMGAAIDHDTVISVLDRVGVGVDDRGPRLGLLPPSWRPDLIDPYDYVEEVGRVYGYPRVQPVIPVPVAGRGLSRDQRLRRLTNSALADTGHTEVVSFPFIERAVLDQLRISSDDRRRRLVRLANPLSQEQADLRTTLLPGLLSAVRRNTSRSIDNLALYEIGTVFLAPEESVPAPRPATDRQPAAEQLAAMDAATGVQPRHFGAVFAGYWRLPGWTGPGELATWRHAIAAAQIAADAAGAAVATEAADVAPWHAGRCAAVIAVAPDGSRTRIGYAGELHPTVVDDLGLPARSCAAEIDLDALFAAAPRGGTVAGISPHPVVKEDVALIVDEAVPAAVVEQALRVGAGPLLEDARLFDIYRGDQIGAGKKSLAYALRFRARDRTLTDTEAARARSAAIETAADATGAVQRV
jgi:phenylalanyl-tRNA synthetase beta chain